MISDKDIFLLLDIKYKIYAQMIIIAIVIVFCLLLPYDRGVIFLILLTIFAYLTYLMLCLISYSRVKRKVKDGKICLTNDEIKHPIIMVEHLFIITDKFLIKQYGIPTIIKIKDIVSIKRKRFYHQGIIWLRKYYVINTINNHKYFLPINGYDILGADEEYTKSFEYIIKKLNPDIFIAKYKR